MERSLKRTKKSIELPLVIILSSLGAFLVLVNKTDNSGGRIKMTKIIHIEWEGPFSFDDLIKLDDKKSDYGVYQIYGSHSIYGSDVLLYIGKAESQTFFKRLSPEKKYWEDNLNQIKIYVGRLAGTKTPNNDEWAKQIVLAEKLLIYSHAPAYNSSNIDSIPDKDLRDIHILNWYEHRNLLPEVSGDRWTSKFYEASKWAIYGKHGE